MTQDFLNSAIKNVFASIREEALTLGLPSLHETLKREDFLDIASNKMLPHNLDDGFSLKSKNMPLKLLLNT